MATRKRKDPYNLGAVVGAVTGAVRAVKHGTAKASKPTASPSSPAAVGALAGAVSGATGTTSKKGRSSYSTTKSKQIFGHIVDLSKPEAPKITSFTPKEYKRSEIKKKKADGQLGIALKHFEFDLDSGSVKTKSVHVPNSKSIVQRAAAKFEDKISKIRADDLTSEEQKAALQKLVKGFRSKAYKTVDVPVQKKNSTPEKLKADQELLDKKIKYLKSRPAYEFTPQYRIKHDQPTAEPRTAAEHIADKMQWRALTPAQRKAAIDKRMDEATQELEKYLEPRREARYGDPRSFGLKAAAVVPNVVGALGKGTLDVFEEATRPGLATVGAIGKLAVALDAIKGDTAEKIRAARNPLDALNPDVSIHDEGFTTGVDLAQGLFNTPQLGLAFDVGLDPLWFVGAGARAANVIKKTAGLEARLAAEAPDLLNTAEYARLDALADVQGDLTKLTKYLEDAASKRGISTRAPLPGTKLWREATSRAKAREQRHNPGFQQQVEDIVANAVEGPRGRPIVAFGDAAADMAAKSAASTARNRKMLPGFQINIGNPFNPNKNPWFRAVLPLPKDLRLPTARIGDSGPAKIEEAIKDTRLIDDPVVREQAIGLSDMIRDNFDQLVKAGRAGDQDEIRRLNIESWKLADKQTELITEHLNTAQRIGFAARWERLDDFVARLNTNRMTREVIRSTNHAARLFEQEMLGHVERAVKPIRDVPYAIERVQTYRMLLQDVGDARLFDEFASLTPEAQAAANGLASLGEALGRHGLSAGTIHSMVENYAARVVRRDGQPFKRRKFNPLSSVGDGRGAGPVGESFAAKHRVMPESASLADPKILALVIKRVATKPISDQRAAEIAEQWFRAGRTRTNMELLVREIQRNGGREIESLTTRELEALRWSEVMATGNGHALFNVPRAANGVDFAETGMITLARDVENTHGILDVSKAFEGITDAERKMALLYSASKDRAHVEEILRHTTPGSPTHLEWKAKAEHLDREIEALDIPARSIGARSRELRDAEVRSRGRLASSGIRQEQLEGGLPEELRAIDADRVEVQRAIDERIMRQEGPDPITDRLEAALGRLDQDEAQVWRRLSNAERESGRASQAQARAADAYEDLRSQMRPHERYGFEFGSNQRLSKVTAEEYDKRLKRGADAFNDIAPMPGMKPRRPNYLQDDPWDYTGRIDDLRRAGSNLFFELDPRISEQVRVRVEAIRTAYAARWDGIDRATGISIDDAEAKYGYLKDGTRVPEGQLTRLTDPKNPDNYMWSWEHTKPGSEKPVMTTLRPDEISFPTRMKPMSYRKIEGTANPDPRSPEIYFNVEDGKEYARPGDLDNILGAEIQRRIGENRLWPTDVLQDVKGELFRLGASDYSDVFDVTLDQLYQRTLSMMRFSVTTPFPAYHVRNMVSDVLKSLQADPGMAFHPIANAQIAWLMIRRGGNGKIKLPGFDKAFEPAELMLAMDLTGIRSTRHLDEVMVLARGGKIPGERYMARSRLENPSLYDRASAQGWKYAGKFQRTFSLGPKGKSGRALIEASARREDVMRAVTFMQRLRRNGGDVADAGWYMIKHHFDYGDLSAVERRKARNLFLFYTWYRKNIPLQFMEMITRPAYFAAVSNMYRDFEQGATPFNFNWSKINPILPDMSGPIRQQQLLPEYMTEKLGAVTTNWNGHAAAFAIGFPWNDMNLVTQVVSDPLDPDSWRENFTLLNPLISTTLQLAFRQDLLTGRTFRDNEPTTAQVAAVARFLGVDTPAVTKGEGIPWYLQTIIRNLPFVGRATSYQTPPDETMDRGRFMENRGLISYFTGLNAQITPDPTIENAKAIWAKQLTAIDQGLSFSLGGSNMEDLKKRKQRSDEHKDYVLEEARRRGIPDWYLFHNQDSPLYKRSRRESSAPSSLNDSSSAPDFGGPDKNYDKAPGSLADDLFSSTGSVDAVPRRRLPQRGAQNAQMASVENTERPTPQTQLASNRLPAGSRKAQTVERKLKDAVAASVKFDTGGRLTSDQETFARALAKESGMSPRIAAAVVLYEGGNGTGDNNWANIGWTDGGPAAITRAPEWRDPTTAGKATAKWIRGDFGQEYGFVSSPGIQALQDVMKDDDALLRNWAASGWASSGAGPGSTVNQVSVTTNPISKALKARATRVLGSKETREILRGPEGPRKLRGEWAGSERVITRVVPKGAQQTASSLKEQRDNVPGSSGSSWHDPDVEDAFAMDLPATGQAGENLAKQIARRAGIEGYTTGNYTHWTSDKYPGYEFQILWAVEGHFDHVHAGARWAGGALPSGTYLGGATSGAPGAVPSGPGGPGTTQLTSAQEAAQRLRRQGFREIPAYERYLKRSEDLGGFMDEDTYSGSEYNYLNVDPLDGELESLLSALRRERDYVYV